MKSKVCGKIVWLLEEKLLTDKHGDVQLLSFHAEWSGRALAASSLCKGKECVEFGLSMLQSCCGLWSVRCLKGRALRLFEFWYVVT